MMFHGNSVISGLNFHSLWCLGHFCCRKLHLKLPLLTYFESSLLDLLSCVNLQGKKQRGVDWSWFNSQKTLIAKKVHFKTRMLNIICITTDPLCNPMNDMKKFNTAGKKIECKFDFPHQPNQLNPKPHLHFISFNLLLGSLLLSLFSLLLLTWDQQTAETNL